MIFSTYEFIFLFLPIVLIIYFALVKIKLYTAAKVYLVLASFYFYAQGSPDFFWFFAGSVFFNYLVGNVLLRPVEKLGENPIWRKLLFLAGILANCALLGYYKYTDFFIENYNMITGSDVAFKNIMLPIGISFFTFQLIAYLVDCYRYQAEKYGVINYLLFITFFPQLIVGPIVHHKEMVSQYEKGEYLNINYDNFAKGLFLFSMGCAKKILLADVLTVDAQSFFDFLPQDAADFHTIDSWYYSIEYTISYYFDLSGYADMAIGLGYMFNIKIPRNFNSPYKARNFQDYWQRWHMTLSRFLSDYIFRNVYKSGSKYRNYYVAVMVTFFVSGFWHGAGWTFVAWGVINGIFVCSASYMKRKGWKFPFLISFCLTAFGVVLTRVLFVSNTFGDAWMVYGSLFNFGELSALGFGGILAAAKAFLSLHAYEAVVLAIGTGICWFAPNTSDIIEKYKPNALTWIAAVILFSVCLLYMNKVEVFLYFQF